MKPVFLILSLLLSLSGLAQRTAPRTELGGMVVDSATAKPLGQASVSLLNARDSSYVTGTVTDNDGLFMLRNLASGSYRVLVTYLGYRNGSQLVAVKPGEASVQVGVLRLVEQSQQLGEVVVRQESAPVTIRQDTVVFNAGSFKTQPNAQVEALLRKLPGVEVSRDGTIKANGQTVNRVLVDGKPFFGTDHRMATRNLPADIVDKVQLFDQSSDLSSFSGIDDGNREPTLNLTLKPDKRKGYFGQNELGLGTARDDQANRYSGRLNLNRFSANNDGRRKQISLIGQANNLNQQNFSLGAGGPSGPVGNPEGPGGAGPQSPTNVIEVRAGGVNYRSDGRRNDSRRNKHGHRAEIAMSYFLTQGITVTDGQSRRTSILPERPLTTDASLYSQNRQLNHRFNARLDWQLDSLTNLRLTPGLVWQTADFTSRLSSRSVLLGNGMGSAVQPVNTGETAFNSAQTGFNGTNNLLLTRKFRREGRTLSVNLNSVMTDGQTQALNRSTNTFFDSTGTNPSSNRLNGQIGQASFTNQHVLTLSYTEPVSFTQKVELRYVYSINNSHADRQATDQNEATGLFDRVNLPLTNRFGSSFGAHRAGATFQTQRLRYKWAVGLDAQQAHWQLHNRTDQTAEQRSYVNLLPNALFSYTFSGNRNLRLQYRTRLSVPSVGQLQPVLDNTNPLQIQVGNPRLDPEFYNTLVLVYNAATRFSNQSFSAFASVNQSNNRISTATIISPAGVQTTQPVNAGGFWSAYGSVAVGRTLQPSKLGLTFTTNLGLSRSRSFINGDANETINRSVGQGVRLQSSYNEHLDYGLSGNLTYQTASYSLLPNQNAAFWWQHATADLFWKLPFRLALTTDLTYTGTTGRAAGFNQRFVLWNAALSRHFFKGDTGELRVQVFDLLNQNRSLIRNTTDTYIDDVQNRILRRYLLVSFVYNLRQFGR
ncbi:outer membrane beta-barrel protein [Rudanella paleaurantiibacter]|uniref:Outer membrane beta-barrel protein n=1 Tax=Rudanella paleaurantiibacter TaxID=2614655 RepID=A0A7J5TTU4_9BACT|nr:TonB-dependent receptor [Rudanella paleaurantiibacter]KAB7727287.1 outer membrane beta-barrel protein [Rudanella paleaurantiibacter]